jgi:hypothetical protein
VLCTKNNPFQGPKPPSSIQSIGNTPFKNIQMDLREPIETSIYWHVSAPFWVGWKLSWPKLKEPKKGTGSS